MITGCNTNIRHKGMLFHVQTEDSGRANPHIISHVYYGGTILGSRKQDYADALESPDLDREVRSRIEDQHREMLKALRRGEYDATIDERLGARQAAVTEPDIPDDFVSETHPGDTDAAEAMGMATGSTTGAINSTTAPPTDPEPVVPIEVTADRPAPVAPSTDGLSDVEVAFGHSDDAQKPLDEVILEYLVDKARERKTDRRSSRTKE